MSAFGNTSKNWKTGSTSHGWASVSLKEKRKNAGQDGIEMDPYPSLSNENTEDNSFEFGPKNQTSLHRTFSSVIKNSLNVSLSTSNRKELNDLKVDHNITALDSSSAENKLKDLHAWADLSLIQDVITAVKGDLDEASALLEAMGNTSFEEIGKAKVGKDRRIPVVMPTEFSEHISNNCSSSEVSIKMDHSLQNFSETSAFPSKVIPVEPEWEDDDLYLTERKTAIQVMRMASHHSKAAKNAFVKGDHISARYHSLKAHERRLAAEELDAFAARNILSIRNKSNDQWTLDLHGLHRTEAVQAVLEHLDEIENQFNLDKHVKCHTNDEESSTMSSYLTPLVASKGLGMKDCRKELTASRMHLRPLQVITGVGNHGHGEATLPAAVKIFLHEKGYHYDEPRPGVLSVWPKYRRMPQK